MYIILLTWWAIRPRRFLSVNQRSFSYLLSSKRAIRLAKNEKTFFNTLFFDTMILLNQMPPKDTYAAKRQTRSSSWYLISNYHFRILLGFACINFNPRSGRNTPGLGAKIPPSLGKVQYWTFSPIPVNFLVILFFFQAIFFAIAYGL